MTDWGKLQEMVREETEFERKMKPILTKAITILISYAFLVYVYMWVLDHYGFERAIIGMLALIIIILKDLPGGLTEKFKIKK